MLPKVYLETSLVSYLTAWESGSVDVLAKQRSTREWWDSSQGRFEFFVSDVVLREARRGDGNAVQERLDLLESLPVLKPSPAAENLAVRLVLFSAIPKVAADDAAHVAIAAVNRMNYLLTWSFRHLNNASKRAHIAKVCAEAGFVAPEICTPEELELKETSHEV
jgi:hypothetical protein